MEESPDFREILIECRIEIVLTVRGCLGELDMTIKIKNVIPIRRGGWRNLLTIGKFS